MLRLALPSERQMEEPTLQFLDYCGLSVSRPNARAYTGSISSMPGVSVLFQRSSDIARKLEEGSADLGIMGMDYFLEERVDGGDSTLVLDALGYGHCELVVGVPDSWIDVTTVADLADLATEFHEGGRELRIATKYPRLTQSFLMQRGINYFEIVGASGAMEVAPAMGYADLIVDITSTGNTLRDNRLKTIDGGTIVKSQACLVGNRKALGAEQSKLTVAKSLIAMIEGRLEARGYYSVIANVRGASEAQVAARVLSKPHLAGVQGPTISKVFSKDGKTGWFSVTVVVPRGQLMQAIDHLGSIGSTGVTVLPAQYVFSGQSPAYSRLLGQLKQTPARGRRT